MLGRHKQAISDAMKALELGPGNRAGALAKLSTTYDELGDYRKAAKFAKDGVATGRMKFAFNSFLSLALANLGSLKEADAVLRRLKSDIPKTYKWRRGRAWAPIVRALVGSVEGVNLYLRGNYAEAEAVFRSTVAKIDEDIADGADGNTVAEDSGLILADSRQLIRSYISRSLALSLMRQGRLAESEAVARDTLIAQLRHFGRYSGQTVEGLAAMTEILSEQGRYADAETLAHATIDVLQRMGAETDSITLATVRRTLADAQVGNERWSDALGT